MTKITGFLEQPRVKEKYARPATRIKHFREFVTPLDETQARRQATRCMDCGIPFCSSGCPVNNIIPDFNNLVYQHDWQEALNVLHSTNNFPEFTGRACPAPCEAACVLNISQEPVGIKSIELAIIERGWQEGWVTPQPAAVKTGKKVAVVGSGPAGLAAAQQLARTGHDVTVFEKNDRVGGLLRYGIPDFKLEKHHIDRRVEQMEAEGVTFRTGVLVGDWDDAPRVMNQAQEKVTPAQLQAEFDAVLLAGGAETPRDLSVKGRDLGGVHFAMEFLPAQNRATAGDRLRGQIRADGKRVIVIGSGDTGSDCVGISHRQGAASVTQFARSPRLPEKVDRLLTWPYVPLVLQTTSSHEEGGAREYATVTKEFVGKGGKVTGVKTVRIEIVDGKPQEIAGSEQVYDADLVLLALGFANPMQPVLDSFGVQKDRLGNALASADAEGGYATSMPGIFAAGDMRRGQSLIVWAIREGRQAARAVDEFLMGASVLPR